MNFFSLHPVEYLTPFGILLVFLAGRICRVKIFGEWITGVILGIFFEIATEPNWDYNLTVYLYKDVSPFIMLGWGTTFTIVVKLSEFLYKKMFRKNRLNLFDRRLFLTDMLSGVCIFTLVEFIGIKLLRAWSYNPVLGWSIDVPWLGIPLEAILGLALFSLVLPTFVRHWQKRFDL